MYRIDLWCPNQLYRIRLGYSKFDSVQFKHSTHHRPCSYEFLNTPLIMIMIQISTLANSETTVTGLIYKEYRISNIVIEHSVPHLISHASFLLPIPPCTRTVRPMSSPGVAKVLRQAVLRPRSRRTANDLGEALDLRIPIGIFAIHDIPNEVHGVFEGTTTGRGGCLCGTE